MQCEMCETQEATVHLTQVVDGAVKKLHLCEPCAQKSGFDVKGSLSITDILLGMGGKQVADKPAVTERSCPACHLTRASFKKSGRLGCEQCYAAFADELEPLIKAMHRHEQHSGKVPGSEGLHVQVSQELMQLQQQLEKAVAAERFEEAAELRDRIHACEKQLQEASE